MLPSTGAAVQVAQERLRQACDSPIQLSPALETGHRIAPCDGISFSFGPILSQCKLILSVFMTEMFEKSAAPHRLLASLKRRPQPYFMITSGQIRAARGLLNWSAAELARRADVAWRTVQRAESGEGVPRMHVDTLEKIQRALEAGGVEIIPQSPGSHGGGPGVRLRRP